MQKVAGFITFSHFFLLSTTLSRLFFRCAAACSIRSSKTEAGLELQAQSSVRQVWRFADAAVVGSAIVREIERIDSSPELVKRVGEFARSLVAPAD